MNIFKNFGKLWSEYKIKKENDLIGTLLNQIKTGYPKFLEDQKNSKNQPVKPYNKEYHDKLSAVVQNDMDQKDQFINWLTGIAAAAMILIFTEIPELADKVLVQRASILNYLIYAGIMFMIILIIAIIFKLFSGIRYLDQKLDVEMMEMSLTGTNMIGEMQNKMSNTKTIDSKTFLKFLKHFKYLLENTSSSRFNKIKLWTAISGWVLETSYYSSLTLFLGTMIFTTVIFVKLIPPILKLSSH